MSDTNQWDRVRRRAVVPVLGAWIVLWSTARMFTSFDRMAWFALAIPIVAVIVNAMAAPSPQRAVQWAARRGAAVSAIGAIELSRRLLRMRVARAAGVSGAIAADMVLVARYNADPPSFGWYTDVWNRHVGAGPLMALGYVVGSMVALRGTPAPGSARVVSLRPRRVLEFVDPWLQRWMVVGLGAVVAGGLVQMLVAEPSGGVGSSTVRIAVWAASAAAAFGAAAAVARRPERAADPEAFVVEELTRTSTVNSLWACSVFAIVSAAGYLASPGGSGWRAWLLLPFGLLQLLALSMWGNAGSTMQFRTRRIDTFRDAQGSVTQPGPVSP